MEGNFNKNLSSYLATYLFIGIFIVLSAYLFVVFFHHVLERYLYRFFVEVGFFHH